MKRDDFDYREIDTNDKSSDHWTDKHLLYCEESGEYVAYQYIIDGELGEEFGRYKDYNTARDTLVLYMERVIDYD